MDAAPLVPPPDDRSLHRILIVLIAVLLVAGATPLFAAALVYRFFHSITVLVLVLAALAVPFVPALLAWRAGAPPEDVERPAMGAGGVPLAIAAVAAVYAVLAVALTAQTFVPALLAQAQANTLPYAVLHPLAAAAFVTALALLDAGAAARRWSGTAAAPLVGRAALLGLAGAALAEAFGAGGAGPVLPPQAWLLGKVLVGAALVFGVSRVLARRSAGARAWLAWLALAVAVLDVVGTAAVLANLAAP